MIRPLLFLSILVVGCVAVTAALADVALVYAYGQLSALVDGFPSASNLFENLPTWEGEVSSGDANSVRSYQSVAVSDADGQLRATGTFGVEVIVEDGATMLMSGNTHIEIFFTTNADADYVLQGTLPAEATVVLSGLPDGGSVTASGPGDFDLTGSVVPGREYTLFLGVHAGYGADHDLPGDNRATLDFAVGELGAVPTENLTWGGLRATYR